MKKDTNKAFFVNELKKSMLSLNKKLVIKNKFHNDMLHRPDINQ